MSGTKIRYELVIISQNSADQTNEQVIELDGTLNDVFRFIRTYKAKKGYAPFYWQFQEVLVADI